MTPLKRNMIRQVLRHRRVKALKSAIIIKTIGPNDVYLPSPYDTNAALTFGTSKSLTVLSSLSSTGEEVAF